MSFNYFLWRYDSMIQVEVRSFAYENFDSWCLPWDYHCLYILENGYQVYIGETKDVIQRSKEHCRPSDFCNQFQFQRVYIITSEDFEETPAKHYEDLLIRLMRADGKFSLSYLLMNFGYSWKSVGLLRKSIFILFLIRVCINIVQIL